MQRDMRPAGEATEWCLGLQRMKFMTEPMSAPASVSVSRKERTSAYHWAVRSGSVPFSTTCDRRTGIDSRSSILRWTRI